MWWICKIGTIVQTDLIPATTESHDLCKLSTFFWSKCQHIQWEVVFYLSHDTPGPMRVTLRNLHTFEGSIIKLWGWWKLFCVKLMMYIMKCMEKGDNSTKERIFLLEFYAGVCLLMTYQFLWDWYLWIESMYIPASNRSLPKNWFKYAFWNRSSAFVDRSLTAILLHSS